VRAKEAESTVFIVGSAALGRYLLLRGAEHRVMSLIDGARAAGDVWSITFCPALMQRLSHSPDPATQPAFVGDCGGSLLEIDGGPRRIIVLAPPGAAYAARRHRQPAYLLERGFIATFVGLSL